MRVATQPIAIRGKSVKKHNSNLAISVVLSAMLVACGGGNDQSSSTTSQSPTHAFVNPTKAVALDGSGYISTPDNKLHLAQGKSSSVMVHALGTGQSDYLKSLQCRDQTCTDLVTISMHDSKTAKVHVTIPKNLPSGSHEIKLYAGGAPNASVVSLISVHVGPNQKIQASYIDMTAASSAAAVPAVGYAATNLLIFAFVDTTQSTADPAYLKVIQNAISNQTVNTVNLLSIGGQNGNSANIVGKEQAVVNNVISQIKDYNSKLTGGAIAGVDLDLEGDNFTEDSIVALAQGFKNAGYVVSMAPQAYVSTPGANVDSGNPSSNLVLTPSGSQNTYGKAVAMGLANYLMVQTYNTNNWTVDGYNESNVEFFSAIAKALNNSVKDSCPTTATGLCIAKGTQIAIGEPANAGAGGFTIFWPTFTTPGTRPPQYDQATILNNLKTQIDTVATDNYANIHGVMMWALGNDYAPDLYQDAYAQAGAFSTTIFGAPAVPPRKLTPPVTIEIQNTGTSKSDGLVLQVNGLGYTFAGANGAPLTPGQSYVWGTSGSAGTQGAVDSWNLDHLFANTTNVLANIAIWDPSTNWATPCATGPTSITLSANNYYHVMVNLDYKSCAVTSQPLSK